MSNNSISSSVSPHRYYLPALILISGFILFYGLGALPLMDRDETRYAIMAKEMVERNDWVVTFLNGEHHLDKPPLFTWLVALSFKTFGFTEFAARLIPALMAFGTVLIAYALGSLFWNLRTGFLAGIILSTSIGFYICGRFVITDMTLTFFSTLAMALILGGLHLGKRSMYLLSYVAFSGAVLTKGPVGIVLPAIILLLYLWKTKQLNKIKEMYIGWGILIIAILSLPWFFLANQRVPGYFYFFFIQENVLRYFTKVHQRSEPIYFYIPVAMIGLFPWIWFLPFSLMKMKDSEKWKTFWDDSPRYLCFVWFSFGFVFFSLSGSKLASYLLPYMIPAALLIGAYWDKLISESKQIVSKPILGFQIFITILGLALLISGILIPADKFQPSDYRIKMILHWPMWYEASVLLTMGIFSGVLYKRRKPIGSFSLIMLCNLVLIFHLVFVGEGARLVESYTTRVICEKLNQIMQNNEPVLVHHEHRWSVLFYLKNNRNVKYMEPLEDIAEQLNQSSKAYVILLHSSDLTKLQKMVTKPLYSLLSEGDQLLISN